MGLHVLPPAPLGALLTVPEAAQLLGIAPSTLYQFLRTGRIRQVRLGRAVRVHPEEVERVKREGVK